MLLLMHQYLFLTFYMVFSIMSCLPSLLSTTNYTVAMFIFWNSLPTPFKFHHIRVEIRIYHVSTFLHLSGRKFCHFRSTLVRSLLRHSSVLFMPFCDVLLMIGHLSFLFFGCVRLYLSHHHLNIIAFKGTSPICS